jgi:hypothetical protein
MTIAEALQARHAQPPKQRPGYVALHSQDEVLTNW